MPKPRTDLQTLLEEMMGNRHVYFQPPPSIQMQYPAIVYALDEIDNRHANNHVYAQAKRYQLTVIDKDPDGIYVEKASQLPTAKFERQYKMDNLNHTVFTIYF